MRDVVPVRVRFGDFELDLRTGELCQGEHTILLQEQSFQVLLMLVDRDGEPATREEIQKKLWPNDTVVDFDKGITAAIMKLRKALGDSSEDPKYIETVGRRGYRLIVPVERVSVSVSSDPDGAASRSQLLSASLTGRTVSHYRVLEIVGGGGMGVVYRAEDLKLGRAVALKFLPEELGNDPKALERFEREARAASALDHPNICSIYEFGEHEGQPFIVMQLLEGQTLRDHLASVALRKPTDAYGEQAFPTEQLLDVAVQVASGLEAAHKKGIIHRDIKPANIFLTDQGLVKILDFGVAKLVAASGPEQAAAAQAAPDGGTSGRVATIPDGFVSGHAFGRAVPDALPSPSGLQPAADLHLTGTGSAMGTAGYMSPEQIRGEKVDARTDLFSFGLVLYEMATGQRAFSGDTAAIVHDAILKQIPISVHERNSTIPPKLEEIIGKAIEKDCDLRYQSAAEMRADLESLAANDSIPTGSSQFRLRSRWMWLVAAAVVCVTIIAGGLYWRSHKPAKLTDKDTIVVSDFDNKTEDAVFDDTLRQGLSMQLEQSPFLELVSERKVSQTLKLMGRSAGDRLTPEVTREVCQRTGSKAMLTGSIAELGSQYLIGLKAVDCNMGDLLAEVQGRAASKEAVLGALDEAAVNLRSKLGESLSSVEKYATPLAEATTPSLEALKAYSLGRKTYDTKGDTAALPFYKRAVELDPNFAMAYQAMSLAYANVGQVGRMAENARKAYELRESVSERERFSIEATYYLKATGELEKAAQVYALWQQTYPRDVALPGRLAFIYGNLGNQEKNLEESREEMRLDPNNWVSYNNLAASYVNFNRIDEAEAVYKQAEERKLESEVLFEQRYELAFVRGDTVQMAQLAAAAVGKPGLEDLLLSSQADTEAWYGRFRNSRELTQQAMDSARRNDSKENAANCQAWAALLEVESGNRERARAEVHAALKLDPNRQVRESAAQVLARAGDAAEAEKLADELDNEFPLGTLVQRYWLPMIRAAIALQRKDPNQAIELLKVASALELNSLEPLYPVYLRGEAYLMLRDGNAAAAEFRKFVDHYGTVGNFPLGALARLGLARAYALDAAKDPAARDKARNAYQNFLTLWKDADPDIPIYKQAKAEYAKLQ